MQNISSIIPIFLAAVLLWLAALTYFIYRIYSHYNRIARSVHEGDLIKLLNSLLDSNKKTVETIEIFKKDIHRIDDHLQKPIQKIGLVKYNPFSETGGDQSFSVCLLDNEESGLILTTIHTRDRTRIYMKPIKHAESLLELSKEEKRSLAKAVDQKSK